MPLPPLSPDRRSQRKLWEKAGSIILRLGAAVSVAGLISLGINEHEEEKTAFFQETELAFKICSADLSLPYSWNSRRFLRSCIGNYMPYDDIVVTERDVSVFPKAGRWGLLKASSVVTWSKYRTLCFRYNYNNTSACAGLR
jgi:hypothetical protein